MDILQLGMTASVLLAKFASILVIIYLPMIVGARWLPKIDTAGMYLMPVSWNLPIFAGVLLGGSMVYYNLDEEFFTIDNIFRTDGPWNLSYASFLLDRVNPFNYHLEPVLTHLTFQGQDVNVSLALATAAACLGLLVLRALSTWHSFGAWRGIAYGVALAVWACYMTIFGVCLVLWLMNLLNFWLLAVLTIAVHLYRTHSWPFTYHSLMAPVWGDPHGHGGHGHGGHGHGGHGGGHGHDAHGGGHGGHGHEAHGNGHGHDAHGGGHGHDSHGNGHGGGHDHEEEDDLRDAVHPLYPRHH